MQKLVEGVHKFQKEIFGSYRTLFEGLAEKQRPETLFITCSDSRVVPTLITQSKPGELFSLRNAGNIVPPYGIESGAAATVEFAVRGLKIRDVVVCGHTGCGAMDALLNPEMTRDLPAMASWLQHARETRRILDENYAERPPEARRTLAVEENVLVQLENLRTHPSVAEALERGELRLHGLVYKIATGEIFEFDPTARQFRPLATRDENEQATWQRPALVATPLMAAEKNQ